MKRAAAVIAVALVGVLSAGGPAAGAEAPRLAEVDGSKFPERAWVLTLPHRQPLAPGDVEVRENGRAAEDVRLVAGDEAGAQTFGVVLAIDASNSMEGQPIEDAMAAARAFAAQRRPAQQMGLVFFSRKATVALPLTTDAQRIEAALASAPALTKGTRVIDAAGTAMGVLRDAGVSTGSVVILSDGADAGSRTTVDALAAAARRARTRVFSVGLESASFNAGPLSAMAAATGGRYAQARTGKELGAIYARLGEQLANEYLVTYRSLARADTEVRVEATVEGFTQPAVAGYTTPSLAGPAPVRPAAAAPRWPAIVAACVVALLLGVATLIAIRRPKVAVGDRIVAYANQYDAAEAFGPATSDRGAGLGRLTGEVLDRVRWWRRMSEAVELAEVGIKPLPLVAVTAALTVLLLWGLVAAGRPVAGVLVLSLPLVVRVYIGLRVKRRRRAFADQLADNFQVIASAMRAGHSFESGLAVAAADAAEPMRSELQRVVTDERLGVPLETAMATAADRMKCAEFEQVAHIVVAQRNAGGNVSELLDHTVDTLRERGELRRMVLTLTAQGRFGGAVVSVSPFAAALFLSVVNPGFFDAMLASPLGVPLFALAGTLIVTAWLIIRKVVDIKV